MPTPTAITVTVDNTEYSRYEDGRDVITATVNASGGAPYTAVPIQLELIKARRSRDAVVGEVDLTLTSDVDNTDLVGSFALNDLVDSDLLNLVRHGDYFIRALYEATAGTATIGSGTNGTITVTSPEEGTAGDAYTIEVAVPATTQEILINQSGTTITVNLAVNAGVPVTASNTAVMIVAALASAGISASFSGTGADSLSVAEGPTNFSGGTDEAYGDSEDFRVRILTVERFKKDYLFGLDLKSTAVLGARFGPTDITGVTITEVSSGHPKGLATLSYTYNEALVDATADIGGGTDGTVTVTATDALEGEGGNAYTLSVVVPAGTSALSATLTDNNIEVSLDATVGVVNPAANTATLIAAEISNLTNFSAVASGTGASSLSTAEGPTAFSGGTTTIARYLSWAGGPAKTISGPGTYVLPAGAVGPAAKLLTSSNSSDYIIVRVTGDVFLPTSSVSEDILIDADKMCDETLCRYLDEAIAYVENDYLNVYLEPTNVVTDRDPTTIQYTSGINAGVALFEDSDYDFIKSPLTYFIPVAQGRWVEIHTPYPQLLRVDSLFGAIADTRVITIDLSWVEHSEQGGLIQLVPFNQETAFDFLGLIWINAIRGATELPNFWHYNLIVGLRDTPAELQEYVGKYAAITALTAASLAFRPGVGSLSLSRDGVSESISYNTQAQYGAFTGAIQSHKDWIEDNSKKIRAKYRGLRMVVV